jgi:hypothetical protein
MGACIVADRRLRGGSNHLSGLWSGDLVSRSLRTRFPSWPRLSSRLRRVGRVRPDVPSQAPTRPPGPIRSPIQDQVGRLSYVTFIPSSRSGYRINLVVPTLESAKTFGGIQTALQAYEAIAAGEPERRIIADGSIGAMAPGVLREYAPVELGSDPAEPRQIVGLDRTMAPLAVRPDDVFVSTFWTTTELVERIRRWQSATFGRAPERSVAIVQDYEPGFYPWSAQWTAARATFDAADRTIAMFNTSILRDYIYDEMGIRFARDYVFEPRLLPELRRAMESPSGRRSRTVVVYGRPGTPRNAFAAIIDALRHWCQIDPGADRWSVVSVGQSHPDYDLGGGSVLRSVGKLDIAAYASLLRESAVGMSLMVSPHPSYPPLEMAHLGMLVVSNRFGIKDLSTWHTNIRSTTDLSPAALADALVGQCARFEADPDAGSAGRSLRPDYISDEPQFPFAAELAAELRRGVVPSPVADPDAAH